MFKQILKSEQYWTKNCCARDKDGNIIDLESIDRGISSEVKRLYSFSLQGILTWYFPFDKSPESRDKMRMRLRNAIRKAKGHEMHIAAFNDHPETTFEDIKQVLRFL